MVAVDRTILARSGWAVLVLVLLAPSVAWGAVTEAVPGAEAPGVVEAREIRTVHTSEFGLPRPSGIAYDPVRDRLLVAGSASGSTPLILLDRAETLRASTSLPAGDPGSLTFDATERAISLQRGDALLTVPGVGFGDTSGQVRREPLSEPAAEPVGATVDGEGTRLVLDAEGPVLRVADPRAAARSIHLDDLAEVAVRALAYNPADDLLYVGSPDEQRIYGLDDQGDVRSVHDYAHAEILDLQAMVFAPSSDTTDDPDTTNLFVADAGDDDSLGGVTELTLEPASVTVTADASATLIQTIDTSQFDKPSPDPSGVTYLPGSDRLLLVDSEVNEVTGAGQNDTNLWELTRDGTVERSGSTLAYSDEPTGVDHDPDTGRLFVTDDTQDRIYIVTTGADELFGTPDDEVSEFRPSKHGPISDTEDPAFDPASGHLFFLDGVSAEVYRIDPVNGVFGDDDDVVTHFDLGQHDILSTEALALHPDRNTLFVGERQGPEKRVFELTKDGQLLQVIDVSAATDLRRISGLAYAPSSIDPAVGSLWITDRGVDNDSDPEENDGQLFEFSYPEASNTQPTVSITSPPDDTSLTGGEEAIFEAVADDPEDGDLTDTVVWRSDLDGTLGSGGRIEATLSSGTHAITASVTDTDGITADDTITVVVSTWPPTVRITAPEDGSRVPGSDPVVLEGTATDPEDGDLTTASGYASRKGGPVLGISSESPNTPGPFVDGNENLYYFNEGDGARATARKSTDGGDTWAEIDAENKPVINDLESIDAVQVDDTLYLFNNEGDRGHLHAFNTSSHPSVPDRWVIRDEPVEEGYDYAGEQQTAALEHRTDGTFVAFYNKGDDGHDRLYYRVRSVADGWGPVRELEVQSGTEWLSVTTVVGQDDKIHIFYRGQGSTAEGLYHRSLAADGTLSERELISDDLNSLAWPMAGAIARVDGDRETVQVVYQGDDERLYAATVIDDGPPGMPTRVADEEVARGETFGSHQVVATVDSIGDQTVVIYADAASRDVWYSAATGDGAWSDPEELLDDVNVFWVRGRTIRHDQSTRFGFVYDEHSGGRADRGTYAALWPRGLQWHSDRDGLLGVGAPLTTMLSGDTTHRITATVTDSGGATGTDAITLHVESDQDPVVVTNTGLTLAEGATSTIEQTHLETSDGQSGPDALTYTLDGAPAHGTLRLDGTGLAAGGSFTQEDIDQDRLAYVHDGSETTADVFDFTVADGDGNTVSGSFAITVTPVDDPPAISTNTGLTLDQGTIETIDGSRLETTDPDTAADALVYTVDDAPAHGAMRLDGTGLATGGTFTQDDIDQGRLAYAHDDSETTADAFDFTVADGDGNTVSGSFAITVTPVDDPPDSDGGSTPVDDPPDSDGGSTPVDDPPDSDGGSTPVDDPLPLTFDDVPVDHLFRADIDWLSAARITNGCAPDRFCPDAPVTRAQMAAFLGRALELSATSDAGRFADVPAGHMFETDINRLATAGITKGCAPDRFCPDAPVTRAQMAAFLGRALELSATSDAGRFADVPAGHMFETDINRLATAGITKGCAPDRFCPDAPVTRAQMAAFLHRALG